MSVCQDSGLINIVSLSTVIKDLESEVAKIDKEDEVTEMGLLEKMDKSLKKVDQLH
jgi:hypothetical protein